MDFKNFRDKMQAHIDEMIKDVDTLFEVDVDKDAFWNLYLDSFPEGTNPIYRERREFDCSCCRQFFRHIANMVVIKNNKIQTMWGFDTESTAYQPVVDALDAYLKERVVTDRYYTNVAKIGTESNKELCDDGKVKTWSHFYYELPSKFVDHSGRSEGDVKNIYRTGKQVFKRSLEEISMEALDTVIELIAQNSLYKGEEWKTSLNDFKKYKKEYEKLPVEERDNYTWVKSARVGAAVGRIRNHSIGVLLTDISEGMDLDSAVKRYENIVAPANYKRPKAIFTKKMLEQAQKTITDLGYLDSLPRRYATLDDITVNNILFSNKDSAKRISGAGDIFAEMAKEVSVNPKKFSRLAEMSADDFVKNVLPTATSVEVLLENKHAANMVSLIAPKNKDAKTMFKWGNGFSWAYSGNMTDSDITERVKAAGGRTDGVLRFSHSWNYEGMRNASLMDLHVFMPGSSQHVVMKGKKEIHDNYGNNERVGWNHRNHLSSGGVQDVDYINAAPKGYIPVENTTFPDMSKLKEGIYTFKIHNWKFRTPTTGGFKAELAFGGEIYHFEHRAPLEDKEWVTLAKLELKNGQFKILEMADNDTSPIEVWGLKTQQFVPVSVICYSPNYWDEQTGNGHRHYFFMLKDCVNPETPNGFYNEFLKQELVEHKRVFEALGGKMAVEDSDDQLSGLGFSATKRNDVIVKVKGATERMIKIKF